MRSVSFLNNLQIKVMLLFLLVALVPLAIVGAFSIKTAEQLIINTVSSQLDNVADDKAALLEKWISERKADIKVVVGSEILKSLDPTRIAPHETEITGEGQFESTAEGISLHTGDHRHGQVLDLGEHGIAPLYPVHD